MIDKPTVEKLLEDKIKNKKQSYIDNFNQTFDIHEQLIPYFIQAIEHSQYNNFKAAKVVWNAAGYINLVSYDSKIIGRDLMLSDKLWQKKLYARQAYLLIYESLNDILKLLGKELREAIKDFEMFHDVSKELNSTISKVNAFKNDNESHLKEVRNSSIAHRDNNMLIQYKSIESISWYDTISLVTNFDTILIELGGVVQKLMNLCNAELAKATKI